VDSVVPEINSLLRIDSGIGTVMARGVTITQERVNEIRIERRGPYVTSPNRFS